MEKQIREIDNSRLHTEDDFSLLKRTETSAIALLTLPEDKAMVDAYKASVKEFDDALVLSRKNSQTEGQKAADVAFDSLFRSSRNYAAAMAGHPVADVAALGATLDAIYDKYGDITKHGYDKEYALAHNLLQDLQTLEAEEIEMLHFAEWVAALAQAYAQFTIAREAKAYEDTTYINGLTREKRLAADQAFKQLVKRVNALAIVNGEEPYAAFIDLVNEYIEDALTTAKTRATRNAKKKKENSKDESGEMTDESGASAGSTTGEETPENPEATPETPETTAG